VLEKSFGNIKGEDLVVYNKIVCPLTLKKLQK
jgi:hypothetical protein